PRQVFDRSEQRRRAGGIAVADERASDLEGGVRAGAGPAEEREEVAIAEDDGAVSVLALDHARLERGVGDRLGALDAAAQPPVEAGRPSPVADRLEQGPAGVGLGEGVEDDAGVELTAGALYLHPADDGMRRAPLDLRSRLAIGPGE